MNRNFKNGCYKPAVSLKAEQHRSDPDTVRGFSSEGKEEGKRLFPCDLDPESAGFLLCIKEGTRHDFPSPGSSSEAQHHPQYQTQH